MEYVYIVIKDRLNNCKTVEVYGDEELAKTRAEKLNTRYYKRPIRYDFGAMCVLDNMGDWFTRRIGNMKKLVCGCFGTIYYATILKNGLMSSSSRTDVTSDAINAVTEHLLAQSEYANKGYAGYKWDKKDGNGKISLVAYDITKYKLCPIISD